MRVHAKIWALYAAIGLSACAQGAPDGPSKGRAPQNTAGDDGVAGAPLGPHYAGSGGKLGASGSSALAGSAGRASGGTGGSSGAGAGGANQNTGRAGGGGYADAGTGGSSTTGSECPSLKRARLPSGTCVERIVEFSVATTPTSIVTGSDGQVWVDDEGNNQLLQLDSEGRVLKTINCREGSAPRALIGGTDDTLLWYTDAGAKTLIRVTQTLQTPLEIKFAATAIARGEGDALWMSEADRAIYQVRPFVGTQPYYSAVPTKALLVGPDGNVWFPTSSGLMAQLSPGEEQPRVFSLSSSYVDDLCMGPDGALWFTDGRRHQIGRMELRGKLQAFDLPFGSGPTAIVKGPDGALWFTEEGGDKIGRMTVKGELTHQFPIPTTGGLPHALTVDGKDNIWFTERESGKVGRLILDR